MENTPSASRAQTLVNDVASQLSGAPQTDSIAAIRDVLEEHIRACNQRLAQLAGWCDRGLVAEAASVERAFPDLCRTAEYLTLRDRRLEWDQACLSAGIELNSRIESSHLMRVSAAVAEAGSLESEIAALQRATLSRASLTSRLSALRSLLEATPRNPALVKMSSQFEIASLVQLESECRAAATNHDLATLEQAASSISDLGWGTRLPRDFGAWLQDQLRLNRNLSAQRSYSTLASRIRAAHAAHDLALLGMLEDEVAKVEARMGYRPSDELREQMRPGMEWLADERQRLRKAKELQDDIETLRRAMDRGDTLPQLEPMRAAVLSHDEGIPEDLEVRYQTTAQLWRRARRRRSIAITGIAAVAACAVVAALAFLAHRQDLAQRAVQAAASLGALIDDGKLDAASASLAGMTEAEPWLLEYSEIRAEQARLAAILPGFERRRTEVRQLLDAALAAARSDAIDPAALQRLRTALADAKRKSGPTDRLLESEQRDADSAVVELEDALRRHHAARSQLLADRVATIRRKAAAAGNEVDRPAAERRSLESTGALAAALGTLRADLESLLDELDVGGTERNEVQVLLDRVARDHAACETHLARLRTTESMLQSLQSTPVSEAEFGDQVDALVSDYSDILNLQGRGALDAYLDVQRMSRVAAAIRGWRENVAPAIAADSATGAFGVSSDPERATRTVTVLDDYIRVNPTGPYTDLGKEWLELAQQVAAKTSMTAGQAALKQVADSGLADLRQVALMGRRWAFVRDGGRGTGVLSGLVRTRSDLTVDPFKLQGDPNLDGLVNGMRVATPVSEVLATHSGQLLSPDLIATRIAWLRALETIKGSAMRSDIGAMAASLLKIAGTYVLELGGQSQADRPFSDRVASWRRNFAAAERSDWPRLALRPQGDSEAATARAEALRCIAEAPDFGAEAARLQAWLTAALDASKPMRVAAVLLPSDPATPRRRVSDPKLSGSQYRTLVRNARTGAWHLEPIELKDGELVAGGLSAPHLSLVFTEANP